ncbi:MAG: methyl-accepting chemotaxis protein [Dehalococcoidales bacterium]
MEDKVEDKVDEGKTGQEKSSISFFKSLKGKLILFFILVGLIPAVTVGVVSYTTASSSMKEEAFNKLEAVAKIKEDRVISYFDERQGDMGVLMETVATLRGEAFDKLKAIQAIKQTQINNYFGERLGDVSVLSSNEFVVEAAEALGQAFVSERGTGGTEWNAAVAQYGSWLTQYNNEYGYYDLFLIAGNGDVVYTAAGESDLGANVVTGALKASPLGKLFTKAKGGVAIQDFAFYDPSNEPASFVGAPLKNGGVVALQIPLDQINAIMQERSGMGRTGETYLVGPDKLMRSDSYLDPTGHSVVASFAGTIENNGVNTEASREGIAGKSGADVIIDYNGNPVLSVWGPIEVTGLDWVLIAEIDVAEAFSPVDENGNEFFAKYVEMYGYYDLFLINPDGYVFYTASKEADYETNMVNGKYSSSNLGVLTREVLGSKQFAMADFKPYAPSNGEPAAFIAQPVIHEGGVELIVALQLPLSAINGIMQERSGMGTTGETYLVGPDKLMRSDSYLDPTGHSVAASFAGTVQSNGVDTEASRNALAGQSGLEIITDYNGNPVLSAYSPMNVLGHNWAMIAEIDESEAMASANNMLMIFLIVTGISAAAVVGVGFIVSRMIANPLIAMVPIAEAVAEGDISRQIDFKTGDEVGAVGKAFASIIDYMKEMAGAAEKIAGGDLRVTVKPKSEKDTLGNAFSQMITNLRGLIGQVGDIAGNLSGASEQLSKAAEQAGQATQQIATTSQQVAKGAGEQSTSLQQTTQGIDQLGKAIQQISLGAQEQAKGIEKNVEIVNQVSSSVSQVSGNAQEAAEGSQGAAEAAQKGAVMARETVDGMEKIKGAMGIASKSVTDLGERSNEIGKIVATIDDIAAQTNLLALNAAIEAARAGEQGRGFAVVADEVRKLAERSSGATKEIADLITSIQSGVGEAVKAMEEGNKEVDDGYKLATDAGESLADILKTVQEVGEQVMKISGAAVELSTLSDDMVKVTDGVSSVVQENTAATEEMSASADQVSKSIEAVAGVSEESSAATQQVSASAEEMSAQVEEVVASSQALAQMSKDLQESVSAFTINGTGGQEKV